MDIKALVTVKKDGKVRDYLMTTDEGDKVWDVLDWGGEGGDGMCDVDIIPLSSAPYKTAEEVIAEWEEIK